MSIPALTAMRLVTMDPTVRHGSQKNVRSPRHSSRAAPAARRTLLVPRGEPLVVDREQPEQVPQAVDDVEIALVAEADDGKRREVGAVVVVPQGVERTRAGCLGERGEPVEMASDHVRGAHATGRD
ncbi:hypothetical protein [Streptomyces natalensis]|uniref:hypothetical protein n=1 Tax=Streptomyces natalensis TaxID=68242 RepID=UPI0012FF236B|nr:hypothetical protein [Streptomyces natalensis]